MALYSPIRRILLLTRAVGLAITRLPNLEANVQDCHGAS